MKGKRFVGLVLSERQAKNLLMYLGVLVAHGAGRRTAASLHQVKVKLARRLAKLEKSQRSRG